MNEALIKLDCVYKAKWIVFKKGYKEILVVAEEGGVADLFSIKPSLVFKV